MTSMTPYAASKIVNATLLEAGVEKVLPPQMFYNYTTARVNKGKVSLIELDGNNKITEEGLATWLEKYVAKNTKVEETENVEA